MITARAKQNKLKKPRMLQTKKAVIEHNRTEIVNHWAEKKNRGSIIRCPDCGCLHTLDTEHYC